MCLDKINPGQPNLSRKPAGKYCLSGVNFCHVSSETELLTSLSTARHGLSSSVHCHQGFVQVYLVISICLGKFGHQYLFRYIFCHQHLFSLTLSKDIGLLSKYCHTRLILIHSVFSILLWKNLSLSFSLGTYLVISIMGR